MPKGPNGQKRPADVISPRQSPSDTYRFGNGTV